MNDIYNILGSSSQGNCVIYNKDIIVDVGLPYSKIKTYLNDIKLILLSHIHGDHFKPNTIKRIHREHPNIKFVCGWWLVANLLSLGISKKNIYILEIGKSYDLGKYIITPIKAIHDVPNCGYKIIIKESDYKILHITDTASIDHINAKNYDLFCVEANYSTDEELDEQIKEAEEKGEFTHLKRVKYTHLSQLQLINWLDKNKGENSIYIFMHEHKN